jgi:hypothetical protein
MVIVMNACCREVAKANLAMKKKKWLPGRKFALLLMNIRII